LFWATELKVTMAAAMAAARPHTTREGEKRKVNEMMIKLAPFYLLSFFSPFFFFFLLLFSLFSFERFQLPSLPFVVHPVWGSGGALLGAHAIPRQLKSPFPPLPSFPARRPCGGHFHAQRRFPTKK
jgi:hypothetical protein